MPIFMEGKLFVEDEVNMLSRFLLSDKYGVDAEEYVDKIYDEDDLRSFISLHKAWLEDNNTGDRAVLKKGRYVINKVIDLNDFIGADLESDFIGCVFEHYKENKNLIKGKMFFCEEKQQFFI